MYARVTNVKYQPEQLDYDDNDSSWVGKYRYDLATQTYQVSLRSGNDGPYLAYTAKDLTVDVSDNECWWSLFIKEDKLAFRRPHAYDPNDTKSMNDSTDSGYYLIMDPEEQAYGIRLEFALEPNDAQLWTLSDY